MADWLSGAWIGTVSPSSISQQAQNAFRGVMAELVNVYLAANPPPR
jgi:hypothetical protein